MTWLEHYRCTYFSKLDMNFQPATRVLTQGMYSRAVGFDILWRLLLRKKQQNFSIIETGTLRNPGDWMDGQSAWLFTEFVRCHSGSVQSVDIDRQACEKARSAIAAPEFSVTCSDSVTWLKSCTNLNTVDLFYLDSYDVDWANDSPSAEHHLQEFLVIEPNLAPGTIVAIDDNSRWSQDYRRTGKGRRIVEYLADKNIVPIYDEYQIIFSL